MEPRELLFMTYTNDFWVNAVEVRKDEIEVGDIFILFGRSRFDTYPHCVEARLLSVNDDETATVKVRDRGVENVKLDLLRRPDWNTKPHFWDTERLMHPNLPFNRRPICKDDMMKHGVAVTRLGSNVQHIDCSDFMFRDYIANGAVYRL